MKKIIALCLSLLLCCTPLWCLAVESTVPMTKGYKGDVNVDGKIDAKDALFTLRITVLKYPFSPDVKDAADVNGNGIVEANDALEILKCTVKKESAITQGVTAITFGYGVLTCWKVLQDNIFESQQAWLCQTYEEYETFMALGYVDESQRKSGWNKEVPIPAFDQVFFETNSLVLWYRPCDWGTGGIAYKGAQVKNGVVYLDFHSYGTDALDAKNAIDTLYGFWFPKGEQPCTTVIMRKNFIGQLYNSFGLSQFDFPQ